MGMYGALAMLLLAGFAALRPASIAWVYIVAFLAFEFWLLRRVSAGRGTAVPVAQPPYLFTQEEAGFIERYRYYFTAPARARQAASVLAALGLSALVLSPWLVYRHQFVQALIVALNLFAVGSLTKRLAPLMVLRIAANKGERGALRLLELHDPLWTKIRVPNEARARAEAQAPAEGRQGLD
jgi:hypothetical protein